MNTTYLIALLLGAGTPALALDAATTRLDAPSAPGTANPNNSVANPPSGGAILDRGSTTMGNRESSGGDLGEVTASQSEILSAQRMLNANGFSVNADGVAGPKTEQAVRDFQAKNGLPQTGRLDSSTLQTLQAVPPTGSPAVQPKASDVPDDF